MFLIYGFVVGMTAGFTVLTAQKFGAGDMKSMRKTVVGAGVYPLLWVLCYIVYGIYETSSDFDEYNSSDIFCGCVCIYHDRQWRILAQMLYNLLSSILRALGNSKLPLYFRLSVHFEYCT